MIDASAAQIKLFCCEVGSSSAIIFDYIYESPRWVELHFRTQTCFISVMSNQFSGMQEMLGQITVSLTFTSILLLLYAAPAAVSGAFLALGKKLFFERNNQCFNNNSMKLKLLDHSIPSVSIHASKVQMLQQ
jgi:hypothetical protein